MQWGSLTHAYNPDQCAVWLVFEASNSTLNIKALPNGNVAPPGNYMVFVVDNGGRPCKYAKFLHLSGEMSMFTSHSHFSEHEVQALLTAAPATVPCAFYVILDGFSAPDLTNSERPFPPSVQFHFADNGGLVVDRSQN